MREGDFRPPTAPRPLDRFSWNLKYITTSRTRPLTQNFRGLCRRGWSGQIASLTHESFCPFLSFLSHGHRSHFWTHPNAKYVIMRRSRQGKCLLGVRKIKFEIWPPMPPKNVKIGTLSWRPIKNCTCWLWNGKSYHVQTWYTDRSHKWHHVTWLQGQKVKVTTERNVSS